MTTDSDDDRSRTEAPNIDRLSTGVPGLDEILHGGLIPERSYLVRGAPGTGKSILGMHYLTAGVETGETALFINLEEQTADIKQNAATLGFDLDGVEFLDLSPKSDFFTDDQGYDVFDASAVERDPLIEAISERVSSVEPDRVFVDPITQFRDLAGDDYQFRKHALSFMRLVGEHGASVLFTTQATEQEPDDDLQFMSDGTIELGYASTGRSIAVPKFRGSPTQSGDHGMAITDNGLVVFPQLAPGEYSQEFVSEPISSGIPEVDELLDGGLDRGTVTVISGPTGVGKTTTGTQFMKEAAGRGERSVMYLFEESEATFAQRSEAINIPVAKMRERGTLTVEGIEPLEVSPQEFAQKIRRQVEEEAADIVMLDGIAGYKLGIQGDEDELVTHLHSLGRYLKNMGVTVILVDEIPTITGEFQATNVGISYLADNILFLRHIEIRGEMRKVIGVLKMRTSDFERTLREFEITRHGIKVGDPLTELRGILRGTPEWKDGSHGGE
ncbi:ATPase domain-containing protein [Halobellus clavatus]|uniref:non-specific serine/threonine protein kinase n=1 Tax=Halobellus clavatus TaxID=660517 RepID=A0A1H3F1U3_9EURY|nr:ATPase domain-containing protein [Halobellus clavatus]SDX84807.1 circadian clock protein KaiC [Halobellus clavatus]